MPRIVITKGTGIGRDHAIGTECVVGRGTEADFTVEDALVSRKHIRVFRDGPVYYVEDLSSRNGTAVNGRRVQRRKLEDGDLILVGGTELAFRQKSLLDASGDTAEVKDEIPAAPVRVTTVPVAPVPVKRIVPPIAAQPARPVVVPPRAPSAQPARPPVVPAPASSPEKKSIVAPTPTRKRRGAF